MEYNMEAQATEIQTLEANERHERRRAQNRNAQRKLRSEFKPHPQTLLPQLMPRQARRHKANPTVAKTCQHRIAFAPRSPNELHTLMKILTPVKVRYHIKSNTQIMAAHRQGEHMFSCTMKSG
jgi:hypothetical protein